MPRSFAAALLSLLTWLTLPALALAQEDPEALIRQGNEMRRRGDPERAYGYFKRAYDLGNTPRTAAQLGLVEQSLGNFGESDRHLSEALASADPWVERNRAALEESRTKARAHLGRIELRGAPAGAEVSIGGSPAVPLPTDGVLYATPGRTEVRILANGRETTSTVSVSKGETSVLEVAFPSPPRVEAGTSPQQAPTAVERRAIPSLIATPAGTGASASGSTGSQSASAQLASVPTGKSPKQALSTKEVVGIATGAAGLGLGVAGFFVYRSGASKLDDINRSAMGGKAYNPSDGNWQTLADVGLGMMVGGAAALAATVLLYWWGHNQASPTPDTPATNVGVTSVPGRGLALQLSGRF
jgi:hypothetical protein